MVLDTGPFRQPTRTSGNQCRAQQAHPVVVLKVGVVLLIPPKGGETSSFSETARPLLWTEVEDAPPQPIVDLQKHVSNNSNTDRKVGEPRLFLPQISNSMLAQPLELVIILFIAPPIPPLAG